MKLWRQTSQVDPQPRGGFWHAIASVDDLLDGFFLKLQGKSLCTHKLPPMLKG
jgi:hypothetical protein